MDFPTLQSVNEFESGVLVAAEKAAASLRTRLATKTPIQVVQSMKFEEMGFDPKDPERALNLVEQVNQTFTYLVTAAALKWLISRYGEAAGFEANLGPAKGSDIESTSPDMPKVAAEVFAAVRPSNNGKLRSDISKVLKAEAEQRYVFYYSPGERDPEGQTDGVEVVRVSLNLA